MKKLVLGFLLVLSSFTLTACFGGDEKEASAYSDKINSLLIEIGLGAEFDTAQEYYDEYDTVDDEGYGYMYYVTEHVLTPFVVDHFTLSLVQAKVTSKQFDVIFDAVNDVLTSEEELSLELLLIDTLLDAKLSSDQLVNTLYNVLIDFDVKCIAAIDSNSEKTKFEDMHEYMIDAAKETLEEETIAALFDLTEEQRADDLLLCKFTFGNVLDYTYSLEGLYNNLKGQFENATSMDDLLTQANLTAILEANKLAFNASFGNDKQSDYKNVIEITIKLNESLDPEFDASDIDSDELASYLFRAKQSVGILFDYLAKSEYQTEFYNIALESMSGDFSDESTYNLVIIMSNVVTDASELFTTAELESVDLVEVVELFTTVAGYDLVESVDDLTDTQEENILIILDLIASFM